MVEGERNDWGCLFFYLQMDVRSFFRIWFCFYFNLFFLMIFDDLGTIITDDFVLIFYQIWKRMHEFAIEILENWGGDGQNLCVQKKNRSTWMKKINSITFKKRKQCSKLKFLNFHLNKFIDIKMLIDKDLYSLNDNLNTLFFVVFFLVFLEICSFKYCSSCCSKIN